MDYTHLKKIKQDANSTTLRHPDGHELKIAHKALPPEHQQQLAAMPHYKDGGDVSLLEENPGVAADTDQVSEAIADIGSKDRNDYMGTKSPGSEEPKKDTVDHRTGFQKMVDSWGSGQQPEQAPAPVAMPETGSNPVLPQQAVPVSPVPAQEYNPQSDLTKMQQGLQGQANAEGALGRAQAAAAQEHQQALQEIQNNYQTTHHSLQAERDAAMQDYKNGHIDPQHYMSSMSNPARVSTAIGLILGGIGGGLTGQENPALKFLNQQIDRDIEGQRAEMDKKHNVLGALNQQFQDLHTSTTMAKAMMADKYAADLEIAAGKSKDPMAQARAMQAIGQLRMQYAPELQQLAAKKAITDQIKKGNSGLDPAQAVPYMVPKEHQKEVFTEIQKAQDAAKVQKAMLTHFDEASGLGGKTFNPTAAKEMRALALPLIHDAEGRVNEYEMKTIEDLLPSAGDKLVPGRIEAKRKGLMEFMQGKMAAPTAKGYGLDLSKFRSTAPSSMDFKPQKR